MMEFLFVAVVAILGFLCFFGPGGDMGRRHRTESNSGRQHAVR
jgi:hypothetical protein